MSVKVADEAAKQGGIVNIALRVLELLLDIEVLAE